MSKISYFYCLKALSFSVAVIDMNNRPKIFKFLDDHPRDCGLERHARIGDLK